MISCCVPKLRKVGAALDKASDSKLFLRKMHHYLLALGKWAVAAIGSRRWSHAAQTAHRDLVLQLEEDESGKEGWKGKFIALLYCELRRKAWAARTRKRERSLRKLEDLEAEAGTLDIILLATAKSRIDGVLVASWHC